jgi:hypothetical protein
MDFFWEGTKGLDGGGLRIREFFSVAPFVPSGVPWLEYKTGLALRAPPAGLIKFVNAFGFDAGGAY